MFNKFKYYKPELKLGSILGFTVCITALVLTSLLHLSFEMYLGLIIGVFAVICINILSIKL